MQSVQSLGGAVGAIAAGALAFVAVGWRLAMMIRRDSSDNESLELLRAAAKNWEALYREERAVREQVEQRMQAALHEVEVLRSEVAELQRKVDHLSALVGDHGA